MGASDVPADRTVIEIRTLGLKPFEPPYDQPIPSISVYYGRDPQDP